MKQAVAGFDAPGDAGADDDAGLLEMRLATRAPETTVHFIELLETACGRRRSHCRRGDTIDEVSEHERLDAHDVGVIPVDQPAAPEERPDFVEINRGRHVVMRHLTSPPLKPSVLATARRRRILDEWESMGRTGTEQAGRGAPLFPRPIAVQGSAAEPLDLNSAMPGLHTPRLRISDDDESRQHYLGYPRWRCGTLPRPNP
jgi:hypothetical protein